MQRKLSKFEQVFYYTLLVIIGIVMMVPFLYMISITLASNETNFTYSFTVLPHEFVFSNYLVIFQDERILQWTRNSLIITTLNIIGQLLSSSFIAFGFARLKSKWNGIFFGALLATMMLPGQVTMIPIYLLWNKLGFFNTYVPLVFGAFLGNAFNVFLIRQFIVRIPVELDEAAKIDGLGPIGIYFKIILPQIKPVLIIIGIFTFNACWGDYFGPLLYLTSPDKQTLAYGVTLLNAKTNLAEPVDMPQLMVTSMLLTIPMIIVFFFGQKRLFSSDASVIGNGGK